MTTGAAEEKKLELLDIYRNNLQRFSRDCLKIRDKYGNIRNFPGLNKAQKYVHARLEQQKRETGKVRALILKGRQQGMSTYIGARYYRRASLFRGVNVYILTHEQTATDNLFKMVERYHTHNPLAPQTGKSNAKELEFSKLDSSYVVATAGQKGGGRSRTITLFHGSEVAFWNNAKDHFASSVQTVPDLPGTEIILETTANGPMGEFYERWNRATAGEGDYIPIFVPWYWQDEYARDPAPDFELSEEPGDNGFSEVEYARMFNLTMRQMAWRRAKIDELGSVRLFDQEYPADASMAFTTADMSDTYILPAVVLRARKRKGIVAAGPKILGVDPSGPGKDKFAIALRQGAVVKRIWGRQMPETKEAILWLKGVIDSTGADRVYVDLGGIGHAIFSILRGMEGPPDDKHRYRRVLRGVNFGGTSEFKTATPKMPGPKNRRAEMWQRLKEWLDEPEGVKLPDIDSLQADLTAVKIEHQLNGDFLLESKKKLKKELGRSPDEGDAVALTFAEKNITWTDSERAEGRDKRATTAVDKTEQSAIFVEVQRTDAPVPPPSSGPVTVFIHADSWMA